MNTKIFAIVLSAAFLTSSAFAANQQNPAQPQNMPQLQAAQPNQQQQNQQNPQQNILTTDSSNAAPNMADPAMQPKAPATSNIAASEDDNHPLQ